MRGRFGDNVRLQHILDAILEIENYSRDTEFTDFRKNSMMRFACVKQMEIIGEASNHISDEIKVRFSSVEWSQIIGMRNVFVHEYFGVDPNLVWDIIKVDLTADLKLSLRLRILPIRLLPLLWRLVLYPVRTMIPRAPVGGTRGKNN